MLISPFPAFEVTVPAALEKNRNLLYQNRAIIRLFCLFKKGTLDHELIASWLLFFEYNYLLKWPMLNHKWCKQWYNRIVLRVCRKYPNLVRTQTEITSDPNDLVHIFIGQ